ncbi:hypothetical protein [Mesorhizobium sp. M0910]|uniref:hypothetical protein n=1 Tax=Mesorhizobium sp. M0910 TaxID=2957025 RepID=UPI00333A08C8
MNIERILQGGLEVDGGRNRSFYLIREMQFFESIDGSLSMRVLGLDDKRGAGTNDGPHSGTSEDAAKPQIKHAF